MGESVKIGESISLLARKKNITQGQIAAATGLSRISINRFFRGHTHVGADDFLLILKCLDIDLVKYITESIVSELQPVQREKHELLSLSRTAR